MKSPLVVLLLSFPLAVLAEDIMTTDDHFQELALRIFRLYQAVNVDILDAQS